MAAIEHIAARVSSGGRRAAGLVSATRAFLGRLVQGRHIPFETAKIERVLLQSEARHEAVLKVSLDAIIVIDHRGRILDFNQAAERIFGYRQEDVFGREMAELIIPPRFREQHRQGLARYLRTGLAAVLGKRLELEAQRFDGTEFPVELAIAAIRQDDRPVFIAFLRDITRRKETEQELKSLSLLAARMGTVLAGSLELPEMLESSLALLVENLGAAFARIWLLHEEDNVLELRASAGQYTHLNGPHSRVPVGQMKIGLIAEERKPHLTNSVIGDPRVADQDWARREGMVAFAGYPLIVDGRVEGVLALFSRQALSESTHLSLSSISDGIALAIERKRSDLVLRASEERTRKVLESITDAFFAIDGHWRFTYVNRRAEQIWGRTSESLLGKNLWQEFPELVGSAYEKNYRKALAAGIRTSFQAYFPPLDLWTEVHAYPSERGLAVYFQDIGERRRMEEKLQQTAKLESLGVMAGGIAHDFNNLLTGILGNASLLSGSASPVDAPLVEAIVQASERAADLTRQMLAYAGKGRFEIRKIDLSEEVREIPKIVKSSIAKNVEIAVRVPEKLPCIEGDPSQIQQLIMNLLINASEAMEGKPGTVTIQTGMRDVDEAYIAQTFGAQPVAPGRYVSLEVHDTGCGMDEETIARMFDPFFTTKFTGRGLGLAAASGIVRGHGGAMKVYSVPGKGTTFKVLFPAAESEQEGIPEVPPNSDWSGTGTVLVIDDEAIVRGVARAALEQKGFRVLVAADGPEGIEIFRDFAGEVSVVLLDMTMPRMSGEETLSHLRRIRPDVPVIVSSGYNEVEIIRRFTAQGIAGFLQKPYSASRMLLKIHEIMKVL